MPTPFTIHIDGRDVLAKPGETILEVCRREKVAIPTLCNFEGLSVVGACRLCLVEVEGTSKLLPSCATPVVPHQKIRTQTDKLAKYRRMIIELVFSERNHFCAVCVSNNHCELQSLAVSVGMDHIRFSQLYPPCALDASHERFNLDHNRCILCTRCVRVCDEVEGAHVWDVMGRGTNSRLISDFAASWGESDRCTSCGKCVNVCPTGALWPKDAVLGRPEKHPERVNSLTEIRGDGK